MDLIVQSNTLRLVAQLCDPKDSTNPVIPHTVQKPPCLPRPARVPLPRCAPEKQGISSDYVASYIRALTDDANTCVHGLMIARNGSVIAECSRAPFRSDVWHAMHSFSKSVTGIAIGMLCDDGLLTPETSVCDVFPKEIPRLTIGRLRRLKIKHLLCMSSGASFAEAGSVTSVEWTKDFLESSIRFEPGSEFSYNSMNSYILAAAVKKLTGKGLCEFLDERLFGVLGIENYHWEKSPQGIEKGGFGLYATIEDMTKLGQLLLEHGVWNGKRLLSENWVRQMTSMQIKVPDDVGAYNYSYHTWTNKRVESFAYNGMFGQNVLVFPTTGFVVACTAGNDDLFQQNSFFELTNRYFSALPEQKRLKLAFFPKRRLKRLCTSLSARKKSKNPPKQCAEYAGKSYTLDTNAAAAVGIMPLFLQSVQNNFTKGVSELGFSLREGVFYLDVIESGCEQHIAVGFSAAIESDVEYAGEHYLISSQGSFATNEDGVRVLKLRISFLEFPNERIIKIFGVGETIETRWSETPGKRFIEKFLGAQISKASSAKLAGAIRSTIRSEFPEYRINTILEPRIRGKLKTETEQQN